MKKLILAATALVALTTASLAGTNDVLLKNLTNAANSLKSTVVYTSEGSFKKAEFTFSGKAVKVFYDADGNNLIGFSMKVGLDELPAGTTDDVQKKFSGWVISDKIMFIDNDGRTDYYLQVTKGNTSIALIVSKKGKVHFYSQVPRP